MNIHAYTAQVRRGASVVGGTKLAMLVMNLALLPIVHLAAGSVTEGTLTAELLDMLQYCLIFFVPCWIVWRLCGYSTRSLLGEAKPSRRVYMMTMGLVLGWSLVAEYLALFLGKWMEAFGISETAEAYVMPQGIAVLLIQVISTAILPPIVEELCFRGLYVRVMQPSVGTWWAIGLSAVMFWLSHYSIEILPLTIGFSFISGYIRERYQSLLPGICAHAAVNLIYVIVNYTGERWGYHVQYIIYLPILLLQLGLGACGVLMFVNGGDWAAIRSGTFGRKTSLSSWDILRGILTSLPMLLALAVSFYFTGRELRFL